MERVVLVDGSNLVYRAFYGLPQSLMTSTGMHTNAIFGFATMFRKLFAGKMPARGAVVFDAPGETFRDVKFADYKATREAMPNDLAAQLPYVHELCRLSGFQLLQVGGVEADDVIGTLARRARAAGYEVQIISGDKDFAQLIDDGLRVVDTMRDVSFDAELAKKKWGVWPRQMVDYLSLVGDKVDNVPGVAGIGDKSAVELLEQFGSLEGIYAELDKGDEKASPDSTIKARQRKALLENRDNAFLSKELVTIDTDVTLPVTLDELVIPTPDRDALNQFFIGLQFYSLLDEADKDALSTEGPTDYQRVVDDEEVVELLSRLGGSGGPVAVVPVFDEEPPAITPLIGLALSDTVGVAHYLPMTGKLSLTEAGLAALVAFLEDASRPKVCHDMKELYRGLRRLEPPVTLRGTVFDTRLASFLIDPTKVIPHRLDQLTKEYLQRTVRPAKSIIGSGQKVKGFSQAEPEELTSWAGHLADAVIALHPIVKERLAAEGQTAQHDLRDLPLSYVLAEMELAGVLVDKDDLDRLGVEFRETLAELEQAIWRHAGKEFNIASTKQLADILFEELKLPVIKKTKTGYSTDSEVLEELASQHPIARDLVEHRKLAKLINTYTDVLARSVHPKTGRIHATFQQTTGATGRLISTDPDLQRTPTHTPEGKRIRKAFIAPPGWSLVVADWSQIELRILAHVTGDPVLTEAFRTGADVHRKTASQLFEVPLDQVSPAQRNIGKTINFATIYGQGPTALAQMLGLQTKDARRYIDAYFKLYSGVKRWLDQTTEEALKNGWVQTLIGRKRYIPELSSKTPMERQAGVRIACNTPIQGSAADLCKAVMLALPGAFREHGLNAKMLMQIHDELVFEVPDGEVEATSRLVKDLMQSPPAEVALSVPLVADVGHGPSWAAAKG